MQEAAAGLLENDMQLTIQATIHVHQHGGDVAGHAEILCKLEKIMSAISDFADKMSTHNNQVDTAIQGLTDDVGSLKQQIADLQASQGQITPADQALLDGIEAKAQAVSDKLVALDALTPPVAPPVP